MKTFLSILLLPLLCVSFWSSAYAAPDDPMEYVLTLVDPQTNEDVRTITDGDSINLANLETKSLNMRVEPSFTDFTAIEFSLNGYKRFRFESAPPYALAGDDLGDYRGLSPSLGKMEIVVTPYKGDEPLTALSKEFSFSIIDNEDEVEAPAEEAEEIEQVSENQVQEEAPVSIRASLGDPPEETAIVEVPENSTELTPSTIDNTEKEIDEPAIDPLDGPTIEQGTVAFSLLTPDPEFEVGKCSGELEESRLSLSCQHYLKGIMSISLTAKAERRRKETECYFKNTEDGLTVDCDLSKFIQPNSSIPALEMKVIGGEVAQLVAVAEIKNS